MRVNVRVDPAKIREILADANATTAVAAAERGGVSPETITTWRRHARRLGDWPNDQDIAEWAQQTERRKEARIRDRRYAHRLYFNNGKPLTLDPTGVRRRIQALHALGWTWDGIAKEAGVTKHQVWRLAHGAHCSDRGVYHNTAAWVSEIYERLCMTRPSGWVADRARNNAAKHGWPPPLAWDNIDDPDEWPTGWQYQPSSRADLLAELDDRQAGITEACLAIRVSRDALERWCHRNGHGAIYSRLVARETSTSDYHNQWTKEAS